MKKILLSVVAFWGIIASVVAQDAASWTNEQAAVVDSLQQEITNLKNQEQQRLTDEKVASIWKRSKFFSIGYVSSKQTNVYGTQKGNMGVAMNMGKTYFLHKKPLVGMVKIGLDAIWYDVNYVNYEKGTFSLSNTLGNAIDMAGGLLSGDVDDDDDFDDLFDTDFNFGWHKFDIGVIGVGPSVHVAPFTSFSNGLQHLRASLYFHFTPTVSGSLKSNHDDMEFHYGFAPVWNFGGNIQYKAIALGVEGRWSSAKYDKFDVDAISGDDAGNGKFKNKAADCRVFIRFFR